MQKFSVKAEKSYSYEALGDIKALERHHDSVR